MIGDVPGAVAAKVADALKQKIGTNITVREFSFCGGGCINHGGRLSTSTGDFFLKWNSARKFPGMFEAEAKGLEMLRATNTLSIPQPIAYGEAGDHQFLMMEFVHQAAQIRNYWQALGEQLAALHGHTQDAFGLDHHNYIGSLPQFNELHTSWLDFFIEQRLQVQLNLLERGHSISSAARKKFDVLVKHLPDLLVLEKPALIHGDLWSGNLIVNSRGEPCLIDPAVYFGHREVELAFTTLFGGFDPMFYEAYRSVFPLESGYEQRFEIYNLYPLLVHANIFGGHYLSQAANIAGRFT
ncbi:MAG: fructosamine kinase family protein [Cyclobacteriaceae bacterium]